MHVFTTCPTRFASQPTLRHARAHLVMFIDDAVEGAVNVAVAAQRLPAIKGYMSHLTRHTSHATTFCRKLQSDICLAAPHTAPAPTHVVAAALKRCEQPAAAAADELDSDQEEADALNTGMCAEKDLEEQ